MSPLEFPCTFLFHVTLYECKIGHHTASFGPRPSRGWKIIPFFTDVFIHLECKSLDKRDVSTSEKLMSSKRKAPLGTLLFSMDIIEKFQVSRNQQCSEVKAELDVYFPPTSICDP